MAINITNLEDELQLKLNSVDANTQPLELLTLAKAADQVLVLGSTLEAAEVEKVTQVQTYVVKENQPLPISVYATEVKITAQAKGGDGGLSGDDVNATYGGGAGGGGGSGAYVKDFPVGFVAGEPLNIEFGEKDLTIGNLVIEGGASCLSQNTQRSVIELGGEGGRVLLDATPVPESADSVVYGLKGGDSGTSSLPAESPSNLLNGNSYGQSSSNFHNTYGGSGGAGAPSYLADGGDGSSNYYCYGAQTQPLEIRSAKGLGAGGGGNGGYRSNQVQVPAGKGGEASSITVEVTVVKPFGLVEGTVASGRYATLVLSSSMAELAVPANCTGNAFVTMGGAGGSTPGNTSNGNTSGAGSGAYVKDFPIGVNPGGTLNVEVGNTQKVGDLTVEAGGNGATTTSVGALVAGGQGGKVIYQGTPQANSDSVINGGDGGHSGTHISPPSDGEAVGDYFGGKAQQADYVGFRENLGTSGGGGAASYGGDGGDGASSYNSTSFSRGESPSAYGAGAGGNGSYYDGVGVAGGARTDITIKFELIS